MTIIYRAKCEHRDVRMLQDHAPNWSPCFSCNAVWEQWKVTESIEWRCAGIDYVTQAGALRCSDNLSTTVDPSPEVRQIIKRTLRRCRS